MPSSLLNHAPIAARPYARTTDAHCARLASPLRTLPRPAGSRPNGFPAWIDLLAALGAFKVEAKATVAQNRFLTTSPATRVL